MVGCLVLDVATDVDLLGKTLEKHGNHDTSFTIVQKWTLQTLKCLTLSTDIICATDPKDKGYQRNVLVLFARPESMYGRLFIVTKFATVV